MRIAVFGLAALLAAGSAGVCSAQDLKAEKKFTDTQIGFDVGSAYGNLTLAITGPNGFFAAASSKAGSPSIDLRQLGALEDGSYSYQLTASTDEKVSLHTPLDNGRAGGPRDSILKSASTSGQFLVKGGAIVKSSAAQPARLDKDAR